LWKVFTARYGLIPYIKQIVFRLLKVKQIKLCHISKDRTFRSRITLRVC